MNIERLERLTIEGDIDAYRAWMRELERRDARWCHVPPSRPHYLGEFASLATRAGVLLAPSLDIDSGAPLKRFILERGINPRVGNGWTQEIGEVWVWVNRADTIAAVFVGPSPLNLPPRINALVAPYLSCDSCAKLPTAFGYCAKSGSSTGSCCGAVTVSP